MRQRFALAVASGLALVATGSAAAAAPGRDAAAASTSSKVTVQEATGTGGPARGGLRTHKILSPDPAALAAAKRDAAADTGGTPAAPSTTGTRATILPGLTFDGVSNSNSTPSDSTGAIGDTRFIEMVNTDIAIYRRVAPTPAAPGRLISQTDLVTLTGAGPFDNVFDPQIMWDSQTKRFYYVADNIVSTTDNRIMFGFSKTATPNSAGDFCKYFIGYGAVFPDYPKLGDTNDFVMYGFNLFDAGGSYLRSAVTWVTKPAAGGACPLASTFKAGTTSQLKDDTGSFGIFTPVPATQADPSHTGWVVAGVFPSSTGFAKLYEYPVNRDPATGNAVIPVNGRAINVPNYQIPSNARQAGATQVIDSSDTRLTQAQSAVDPRFGRFGIWTQHTVRVGAFAGVRWYEIDPQNAVLFQTGLITTPSQWSFNGAVSHDRAVGNGPARFGSDMVVTYNTSGTANRLAINVASKLGAGPLSPAAILVSTTNPMIDFFCPSAGNKCRWGDYSAATPDPIVPAGATVGQVWVTNQWNHACPTPTVAACWATWNAGIRP